VVLGKCRGTTVRIATGFLFLFAVLASPASAAQDDGLAASARRAAALLAASQQAPGYWLTPGTSGLRFERPYLEMDTYLTPLIVDLLAPVATKAGLAQNISRARNEIAGQIEDTGLVRYYGRPDRPTRHAAACTISPDADDTALAWRVGPGTDPRLLRNALAVLDRYRTPEGLYRTWLAPRGQYQCIDVGKDPDPADIGIQMHLVMFLAKTRPAEGRALCAALQRSIADDRIWVYYKIAPLVPIIRQADLRKAGCPLQLPPSHLVSTVPGQDVWLKAGTILTRFSRARPPAGPEVASLLRELARNDFAAVRSDPPLLYHNDMTASTPGYYWSPEFGYALWLRLYFENLHHGRRAARS